MRARLAGAIAAITAICAINAGPAAAGNPAPRDCGLTPSKTYEIHVGGTATCAFGRGVWHRLFHGPVNPNPFVAGSAVNFPLEVTFGSVRVHLDCRSNPRAHGEHDFACNSLNYGGDEVIKLVNQTLP